MGGSVKQGVTTGEMDLPITFDKQGCLTDPYSVVFDLWDCTDCATVTPELIGASRRIPVKFGVGKYYAPITIDVDEPIGKHFIRWYWKESANDVEKTIDREFDVIPSQAVTGQQYPDRVKSLIYELRKKLRDINPDRDYSIAGEEVLSLYTDDNEITITIEDLYNTIYENENLEIIDAYNQKRLVVKSISQYGNVEFKPVVDVLKHYTPHKNIHKITLSSGESVIVTEDHSVFGYKDGEIYRVKPSDYPFEIVILYNNSVSLESIICNEVIDTREYMYDLSVEINQNFVLSSSILVSNSFSPPSSDTTIAGFTKCRGYRWPDEQLANHLGQAVNWLNLYAPISCFSLCDLPCLLEDIILRQAMVYALFDLASLWIHEEFNYSLNGVNLDISRSDKYMNMATQLQDQNTALLERSKLPLMRSMKGLKQSPYTFSRGAALGPLTSGINLKRFVR